MMSRPSSPINIAGGPLQQPGAVLLISCYELGHQPIGLAQPVGFLEQKGYAPFTLDLSVEEFDAQRVEQARVVGISVPMHTALSLGCQVAERIRQTNPNAHICFYGLYASLNALGVRPMLVWRVMPTLMVDDSLSVKHNSVL